MNGELKVIEIFQSIQGESLLCGLPCTFVRLAGCNLDCLWCDTSYAAKSEGDAMDLEDIAGKAEAFANRHVCITGGEPLLQPAGTAQLALILLRQGHYVSVETNGSRDISVLPSGTCRVMDVKCPSGGECGSTRKANFADLTPHDNLKFVMAGRADFDWAIDYIARYELEKVCPLLFSPASPAPQRTDSGGAVKDLLSKGREMAGWIVSSGVQARLQLQIHRLLWPDGTEGG